MKYDIDDIVISNCKKISLAEDQQKLTDSTTVHGEDSLLPINQPDLI